MVNSDSTESAEKDARSLAEGLTDNIRLEVPSIGIFIVRRLTARLNLAVLARQNQILRGALGAQGDVNSLTSGFQLLAYAMAWLELCLIKTEQPSKKWQGIDNSDPKVIFALWDEFQIQRQALQEEDDAFYDQVKNTSAVQEASSSSEQSSASSSGSTPNVAD